MTRAYSRGGNGDPYYYGHPLRAFGLVRHCAQCGAEFVIRAEHHFFCTLPYLYRDEACLQQARQRVRRLRAGIANGYALDRSMPAAAGSG